MSANDQDGLPPEGPAVAGSQSQGEEIDEELMALAGPPPSLKQAFFVALILLVSLFLMWMFWSDLRYLARVVEDPVDLGEADQIAYDQLRGNTYVAIHGLPMVTRSVTFNESFKWFSLSDPARRWFSLSGVQNLLIQWEVPEEEKAYRDPDVNPSRLSLPYDFSGQLVKRETLKSNYQKLWVYYDCLELYDVRDCKHCLGVPDMNTCRETFTCYENNPPAQCEKELAGFDPKNLSPEAALRAMEELKIRGQNADRLVKDRRSTLEKLQLNLSEIKSGALEKRLRNELVEIDSKIARGAVLLAEQKEKMGALGLEEATLKAERRKAEDALAGFREALRNKTREAEGLKRAYFGDDAGTPDAGGVAIAAQERDAGSPPLTQEEYEAQIETLRSEIAQLETQRQEAESRKEELDSLVQKMRDIPDSEAQRKTVRAGIEMEIESLRNGKMEARVTGEIEMISSRLSDNKQAMADLEQLRADLEQAGTSALAQLEGRMDRIEKELLPGYWVLLNGEIPIEKLWVVLVYLALLTMTYVNGRRLVRFWQVWKA